MLRLPGLTLSKDLTLRLGDAATKLTTSDAFHVAEQLIRGATRQAVVEVAAEVSPAPKSRITARRREAAR